MVSFSVVIPTQGRDTLSRTLESVDAAGITIVDEVILAVDGHQYRDRVEEISRKWSRIYPLEVHTFPHVGDWGNSARNSAMPLTWGSHLVWMDDDDVFEPNALADIREVVDKNPTLPHLFRFREPGGSLVWQVEGKVQEGFVGGHCFVPPNNMALLAPWGTRYEGDFDHISDTLDNYEGEAVWINKVIATCRPRA